jgi:diacylglycerol kinase (ATP)
MARNTALVIINPVAGFSNGEQLQKICEKEFYAAGWSTRFHFTQPNENLTQFIQREIIPNNVDLVVAVGGDGTMAAVAAALIDSTIPLGIIPTGTWNAVARHLRLPASPHWAIKLMTGPHSLRLLDMMDLGDSIHAMNLGVGFSASMIKNSDRDQKRKFGNLAYFKQIASKIFGLQLLKYEIIADGVKYTGRASEIFIANYGVVGLHILEDRLDIHPDDGKADLLIFRARTILDLPSLFWHVLIKREKQAPKYRNISASNEIVITTKKPAEVQADGEYLGKTPVKIKVLPQSIRVIAP